MTSAASPGIAAPWPENGETTSMTRPKIGPKFTRADFTALNKLAPGVRYLPGQVRPTLTTAPKPGRNKKRRAR